MPARPSRSHLPAIALLAAALHAAGIARSSLPAQDGLKFIRVARALQTGPWADVVRSTDQHPLYPALVAVVEPIVSAVVGRGPDTWRLAAQLVAAAAAVGLLWPLHGLTQALFNRRVADLAALGFVLLPLPMAVGHDTLSDSLALLAFVGSLRLGLAVLQGAGWPAAVGCGLVAGLGFLARPEVAAAPMAVVAVGAPRRFPRGLASAVPWSAARLATLAVVFLAMVGSYGLVKGEVSGKLALRNAASLQPRTAPPRPRDVRPASHMLPRGLDDPRWDFSPKDEPPAPPSRSVWEVARGLALEWSEGLGWVLALFAVWGTVRDRTVRARLKALGDDPDPDRLGRWLVVAYLVPFTLLLARHELRMGYLSHRHVLTLVLLSLPWAAAGVFVCAARAGELLRLRPAVARAGVLAMLVLAVGTGGALQARPSHSSRWGHRQAGEWVASHARPGDAVLDTRGWAAFVSGVRSYDYWHVRQALTDSRLAFIVVGDDELRSKTPRAATLNALLAHAAEPVAAFSDHRGSMDVGVRVFRFHRPESWEGARP